MSSIVPSIGRKVWLYAGGEAAVLDDKQAFDASIVFVHEGGTINATYFDHNGDSHIAHGVDLRDPADGDAHSTGFYATWMPYQVGQAKPPTT